MARREQEGSVWLAQGVRLGGGRAGGEWGGGVGVGRGGGGGGGSDL